VALKKSRSIGSNKITTPLPSPIKNPYTRSSSGAGIANSDGLDQSNSSRSVRKSLLTKSVSPGKATTSKSPIGGGSSSKSPSDYRRRTSTRSAATDPSALISPTYSAISGVELDCSDHTSSSRRRSSTRSISRPKDGHKTLSNNSAELSSSSDHSARSNSSKAKEKKPKKKPSSLLDIEPVKRDRSVSKRRSSKGALEVMEPPTSPSLADYISSPKFGKSPSPRMHAESRKRDNLFDVNTRSFQDSTTAPDYFAVMGPPISPSISECISPSPNHGKSPSLRLCTASGKREKSTKNRRSFKENAETAPDPFEAMGLSISPSRSECISSSSNHGKSPSLRLCAESGKREKSTKNRRSFKENEETAPDLFAVLEPHMSPSTTECISPSSNHGKSPSLRLCATSGKRETTTKKRRSFKVNEENAETASDHFAVMEPPMSPSLSEYILSSPKNSKSKSLRLTAGMQGFDAPAFSRDTTPYKPKVDKSPRKTPRKASLLLSSKLVPSGLSDAEPAIRRAFENHHANETVDATGSPARVFIRCKKAKPKLRETNSMDLDGDDNISIGPDDLLKRSPDRKTTGSMLLGSVNNSRYLDGNSSKTRMVPVVRQSSSPHQKRRGSKTMTSSFKENTVAQETPPATAASRRSPRSSAPESILFHEGFLVSPSREKSMDNFQRNGPDRQDSTDSFLSVESFSEASPFDSPVQTSLGVALPALPKLSPIERRNDSFHHHNIVFDSETVTSSLAAPKQPQRQSSAKPRRFRG
jgi:trimeric autotransporter adhesin